MRVLHILNAVSRSGNGIIHVAVDLACLQARAGHHVVVASQGGEFEELLAQEGVTHLTLDQTRKPLTLFRASRTLRGYLKATRPDVVHAHMMTGVILASLLRVGLRLRLVATVHNEFQRSSIFMGLADRVIAVSDDVARSMVRRGVPARKLYVVPNGTIGSPRVSPTTSSARLKRPAIVTVAGLYPRKGIDILLKAFEIAADDIPDAHLYVVGEGPEAHTLGSLARASRYSERIHFEGYQDEPQRYLRAADVFVLASLMEPFGLVLSEAREAGCAIVASRVGGIPQALDRGSAGILFAAGDVSQLARELKALLSNPDKLDEWRKRARNNVAWLSAHRVAAQTMGVYLQ